MSASFRSSNSRSGNGLGLLGRSTDQSHISWQQLFIIGGLFLLLLASSIFLTQENEARPYDLESSEPDGLLALALWLKEMSYQVTPYEEAPFNGLTSYGDSIDLLFVHPNVTYYTSLEAQALKTWVAGGRTLVLIGPVTGDRELSRVFGPFPGPVGSAILSREEPIQPLIPGPITSSQSNNFESDSSQADSPPANRRLTSLDLSDAPGAVPLWVNRRSGSDAPELAPAEATVAIQPIGKGLVWHLSIEHDLTNRMLDQTNDIYLIPALLRQVPDGGVVAFDTYHQLEHDFVDGERTYSSLREWLYSTHLGRAILLGALLTFLFLMNQGLRLGPALPMREALLRRESAEYVMAIAGLQRRLGEPAEIARYHHHCLKQKIGQPLGISVTLPDREFVNEWRNRQPELSSDQEQAVREILARLASALDERTLVETVAQIDELEL
ncbi:MAG: DUF4350 domain-containing protein [Chloroflexota bacterium]